MITRPVRYAAGTLVILSVVAACSQSANDGGPASGASSTSTQSASVTATSSGPGSSSPTSSQPALRSSSKSATAKPTQTSTRLRPSRTPKPAEVAQKLPGSCANIAQTSEVNSALGSQFRGDPIYIKDVAIKKIGRQGRVTCRYGLTKKSATGASPPVEIGVSLYATAAQASTRLRVTAKSETDNGATSYNAAIGAADGTVLSGRSGVLVIFGQARVTVAVSVARGLGGGKPAKTAAALATVVATNLQ